MYRNENGYFYATNCRFIALPCLHIPNITKLKHANSHLWLIDCGKGFESPPPEGHESPTLPDGSKLNEAEFCRDLAQRVMHLCESYQIKAHLLGSPKHNWSEGQRADAANAHTQQSSACTLISLRLNRGNKSGAPQFSNSSGVSAYFYLKDQSIWNWITESSSNASKSLARLFLECLHKGSGFTKRGIKKNRHPLLTRLKMPAVVVRCGFLDNREEAQGLQRPALRQRIAESLVEAMLVVNQYGISDLDEVGLKQALNGIHKEANQL